MESKICSKCGSESQPFTPKCKLCKKIYMHNYYEKIKKRMLQNKRWLTLLTLKLQEKGKG